MTELKTCLSKLEIETNADNFCEVQMEKSEELICAEKKSAGDTLPVICDYTIPMNLAELYKQLRISTNRGYFGSQKVFNWEAFLIFLFLFFS